MAASITRRIVCAGAIAGFSALALIANPAIGSAAVTGSSTLDRVASGHLRGDHAMIPATIQPESLE
nr:hypothetical protein JVH1_0623 [Rhodococcus sp. JVH1]